MIHFLVLGLAGALGAWARYGLSQSFAADSFPWTTLFINILGSALMGLAYVVFAEKLAISMEWKPIVMAGFLGAFTTFSTFSLETFILFERGEWLLALAYTLASVILCFLALVLSVSISRMAI